MGTTPLALPVSDFITVSVITPTGAVAARQFNQALIVGPSARIPSFGTNPRLRKYASTAAMAVDGFLTTDPEYIAAGMYFGQSTPPQFVWIGRQDLTAIQTFSITSGGTAYVVGDIVTVVQGGGSNGKLLVTTVASGVVTGLALILGSQGTGYSVAAATTSGGTGSGLTLSILTIGETFLQSVQTCQLFNQNWYGFTCVNPTGTNSGYVQVSDHLALAAFSNTNFLSLLYFGTTQDAAVLNGALNNVALQIQALKDKSFLIYSSTQTGTFPNNAYAAAAVLGLYCGLNTNLANSAFTLNLKALPTVGAEQLTQTQYSNITNANCNVSTNFGPYLGFLSTGILGSGDFFDQVLFRATLVNLIQTNLMNLLVSVPKIPQTDAGEHQLIQQVEAACSQMVFVGYLGPGNWIGASIQDLAGNVLIAAGQPLPRGYGVVASPYRQQTLGNRAARQAMPISAAVLEAGAVHSVVVQVSTQL